MKFILTSAAFLFFANTLLAQNSSIQTHFNDSEPWINHIYNYPGDPTSLLAVHQEFNGTDFVYQLVIPDIGSANPVWISGCTEVTSTLHEVAGGAVFSGDFVNQGNELFFFNGLNPTVFDLNPGQGSSDPEIFQLNDGLFITAFDGTARQLYEFVSPTEVKKVTNEQFDVFLPVGKMNDDYLYEMSAETSPTEIEWELKCARENGGSFTYSTVRTATYPIVSGNPSVTPDAVVWVNGLNSNGQFILIEDITNYAASSKDFYVLNYSEQTQQVTIVDQSLGHGNSGFSELFEFENDICWYVSGMWGIRRSTDGINFSADVNSEINPNEWIMRSHVSEDGVLWTIRNLPVTGESLIRYSNGQLDPVILGKHFHFSLENQGKLYLTDFSYFFNAHYLHEVELSSGIVESYFIDSSDFHSPTEFASVMLDGVFTFLYERADPMQSIDILQLNSGGVGLIETTHDELVIYPNPSDGVISINHNMQEPTLTVYNVIGEPIYQEENADHLHFEIPVKSAGVYIIELSSNGETIRRKVQFR